MTSHARDAGIPESADPARLIAEHRPADFLFAGQQRTFLATGVGRDLTGGPSDVAAALDADSPIAVGVLPFTESPEYPARLVVPRELRIAGPAHGRIRALGSRAVGTRVETVDVPEPEKHVDAVRNALVSLQAGDLRKVVLARALDVTFDDEVHPADVVHNLIAENPDSFTFAAGLPGGGTLVGSSPELLIRRRGRCVTVHPHAGTAPRSPDAAVDERNGAALLASAKDHTEHAVVVDAVVEALRPFCRTLAVPPGPELTSTPAVWHLGTEITGELAEDVSALELAAALHPTPAVCGTPTADAERLIRELEPFDRGYYAGAVGWVDASGDGEWVVAIRCARMSGRTMRLYAGGGIVAASDPQAEFDETSVKFTTLLRAMGVGTEP